MKIIVNKYIPLHGYIAITFFNIIFWRKEYEDKINTPYADIVVNHESIHEAQMYDFCGWLPIGGILFYILYISEWLFRVLFTKDFMSYYAYKHLSFEREAYENEENMDYLNNRKKFSQWKNK